VSWLLFGVFTVAGLAATAAAWTGWTGEAAVRDVGWTLPARVEADPSLVREADRLVRTWCTAAAVLSAVPVVLLAVRGLGEPLPLGLLLAAAAYGFLVVVVGGYPFERIKGLAEGG
jgi:hypothetical protein